MRLGTLIIMSGLPGAGKSNLSSRLASALNMTYLRIDTIEQGLKDICGLDEIEGQGYRLAYRIAQENLRLGKDVIADSVNPWELSRHEWNNVAFETGAPYVNIEILCSDRQEHKRRVENRGPSVPSLKAPTWNDIVNRDYHPWKSERTVIETSGESEDESFKKLLNVITIEITA